MVECRDGAAALLAAGGPPRLPLASRRRRRSAEAVSALVNLGYKRAEAERAVDKASTPGVPLERAHPRRRCRGSVG